MRDLQAFITDHEGDVSIHGTAGLPYSFRKSERRDLCAFLLLDELAKRAGEKTCGQTIISAVEHDIVYLNVSPENINVVASDEEILALMQCGVFYDEDNESFAMFV
jgi:hypothetical protein